MITMKHALTRMKYLVFIFMGLFAVATLAQGSPLPMLQNTADQLLAALKQNKPQLKTNPRLVHSIVRRIVVPHFDVTTMSRLAMGREGWAKASAAQRSQFTKEFTTLVIRTYSSALSAYKDQRVEFKPLRGDISGKSRVLVHSVIIQHDGPEVPVSYRLIDQGGTWKVYDFSVEGVSMVESFRSQFSSDLSRLGVQGLIDKLAKKNSGGA